MKKTVLFLLLLGVCSFTKAQPWTKNITAENPTFFDVQKAFNDYWAPYDVKGGKYLKDGKLVKAPGWKQFKRWEWYWEQRVGGSGEFPANTVVWDEWEKQKTKGTNHLKAGDNWTNMGPTKATSDNSVAGVGRVNCIAFHPTDPNTMWAGTPAGGLWKTTDGGANWTTNYDNEPVLGISSIVVSPSNPNIIVVATGDGDTWASGELQSFGAELTTHTKSVGIRYSQDGGNTWENTSMSFTQNDGEIIHKLIVEPQYEHVFAATSKGIYFSSDGVNYQKMTSGNFKDIEFEPGNTDIIYATTCGSDAQIYRSINYGTNWDQVSNFSGVSRIDIAVHENTLDAICVSGNGGLHSLQYSGDDGATWAEYYSGGPGKNLLGYYDDLSDADGQGSYDLAYLLNPNNPNEIFASGINTWKSIDGGSTWEISNIWTGQDGEYNKGGSNQVVHSDKHFLAYHPLLNNTLFECNDGGIYKSTDNGQTWTNISNGLEISQMYSISCSQTNVDMVSTGLQDNGSLMLEDGEWYETYGGDGMMTHIDPTNDFYAYVSYVEGVIFRVEDGTAVEQISKNLPGGQRNGSWVTPYVLSPESSSTIIAAYDEVFKSTNRGASWTRISDFGTEENFMYMDVAKDDEDVVYVATYDQIQKTINGGGNWSSAVGNLPVGQENISSIKVLSEDLVVVTFSGYDANKKVFLTDDGGTSWNNFTLSGLPNLPVNCYEYDRVGDEHYVGTDMGVYLYDEDDEEWYPYSNDLPNVVVTDLDIHYGSSKLRAGTFGRGLWESDLSTVGIEENAIAKQINVFPNPADKVVTIDLGPLKASKVELVNVKGQVVKTIKKPNSPIEFNVEKFKNGAYNLKITTTQGVVTQSLIIQ